MLALIHMMVVTTILDVGTEHEAVAEAAADVKVVVIKCPNRT